MTRTSVAYVAVVAAGVSAGALGFSVFWAYEPAEEIAPPVVSSAPAPETAPPMAQSAPLAEVATAPVAPAQPSERVPTPERPAVTAAPSSEPAKSDMPRAVATVQPATAPSVLQPPAPAPVVVGPPAAPRLRSEPPSAKASRATEPKIASAPAFEPSVVKPTEPARSMDLNRTEPKKAAPSPVQQRHANAPSQKLGVAPAASAVPAPVRPAIDSSLAITGAQAAPAAAPPVQGAHANAATPKARAPVSQVEAPVAARPVIDTTPVIASQPEAAKTPVPAPTQQGHANAPPTKLSARPQTETPAVARPAIDAGAVTPIERQASAPPPAALGHMSAPPAKLHTVLQGADTVRRATEPERAVPRRLAAIPPQIETPRKPTATDAPPVLVLRGGPPPARYAQVGKPTPPQSVIKVVRGARPLPTGLEGIVQPGALLLRVPD